ncbi:DUF4367 domain-containing protein [Sporosarcina oncorhynchi]|uniref:DUF4367 domain-containing protein n=1 Tax=Sporosarcina oncorhynchi TaxID=3056444 RepID=A0ABZ0L6C2_9BACL|nr:DUF4367 domain-containing protein [Sporosarcina sp. T2O-4]WOV87767.1 DUF4367 domain-containing protein [Sporosarcina sp. T2O-4]
MSIAEKHEMDHIIREALKDQIREQSAPGTSVEEAWVLLAKKRIEENERRPGRGKLYSRGLFVMVAACLLLFTVWRPQQGAAFDNWVTFYQKFQGSVVQVFGGNTTHTEDASSAFSEAGAFQVMDVEYVTEQLSLEEARKVTAFDIKSPTVPADYQLTNVTVSRETNELSSEITLNYVGNGKEVRIGQMLLEGEFGFGMSADRNDTKVKELFINERQATLITFKDGFHQLIWTTPNRYYSIEGNVEEEEIIAIAISM